MRAGHRWVAATAALAGWSVVALAQTPPAAIVQAPPPGPATPTPGPTVPSPGPTPAAPAAPAPVPPMAAARPTLIPDPGDPVNVDEVMLPEKPVLALSGTSNWDDGLKTLRASFAKVEAELARLKIAPAGRPIAVFTQTGDDTFRFDAMVPIAAAPDPAGITLAADMRFAATPSGKAYRFVHKGPYDDVDSTYETITTYLEVKDIVAKDVFFEEFVNDVTDPADANAEVNIFVQPR